MNNIYLRSKESLKSIMFKIIFAIIPLLLAGFYKNGIKLYTGHFVDFIGMFKPLVLDVFGFLIGISINVIYESLVKKNRSIKDAMFSSFYPLYGLLIASVISINTKVWLFVVVTFICLLISKFINKNSINVIALTALIIIFITKLIYGFTFLNFYEQVNTLHLNTVDYLIGRGSGGINTSHVLILGFSLLLLCNINAYKKEIPIYSIIVYSACMIIYSIFTNKLGVVLDNIFSNGILFSLVFIAPDFISSSYTAKGKIIYSIIVGISSFGLFLVYPPLSALGGILIASITHSIIDKIVLGKEKNKKLLR